MIWGGKQEKNTRAGKTEILVKSSYVGIAKVSQVSTICSCTDVHIYQTKILGLETCRYRAQTLHTPHDLI